LFKKTLFRKVAFLMAIALMPVAASTQSPAPQPQAKPNSFDERLGVDDGAALAILFTANMRGNLEMCD